MLLDAVYRCVFIWREEAYETPSSPNLPNDYLFVFNIGLKAANGHTSSAQAQYNLRCNSK